MTKQRKEIITEATIRPLFEEFGFIEDIVIKKVANDSVRCYPRFSFHLLMFFLFFLNSAVRMVMVSYIMDLILLGSVLLLKQHLLFVN
jgi:hypothetical protein